MGSKDYTITDMTPLEKIVHMGYMMLSEYHERGYMTEVAKKVIEVAFIKDGCVKEHEASRKVMEKRGSEKKVSE